MDNLFGFATIFTYFACRGESASRAGWGILGAIILRGVMIGAGAALIHYFDWIIYVFGGCSSHSRPHAHAGGDDIQPEAQHLHSRRAKVVSHHRRSSRQQFFVRIATCVPMTRMFLALISWTSPTSCSRSTRFPRSSA